MERDVRARREAELDELVRAETRPEAGEEERAVHRLILDAATDPRRELTPEELARVLEHVTSAGFDPQALERARGTIVGQPLPDGTPIHPRQLLTPAEVHYQRHVVRNQEWSAGTTRAGYEAGVRAVLRDPTSGVLASRYQGAWQLGVVGATGAQRGPQGGPWLLVDYRLRTGHWVTAFQPQDGLARLDIPQRTEVRWLRPL